jgi:hypothetical protein
VPPRPGGDVHSPAARSHRGGPADVPELFEHDERGHLVVDERGEFVPPARQPPRTDLPDFHALRHTAAIDCDDAEEGRDLLRQKNSNVTRAVYRAHFSDRRRSLLRARMEARHASKVPSAQQANRPGEVVLLERAS